MPRDFSHGLVGLCDVPKNEPVQRKFCQIRPAKIDWTGVVIALDPIPFASRLQPEKRLAMCLIQ